MSPLLPPVYLGVKVAPQCCRRRHFDVGHENRLQLGNTAPVRSHRQRPAANVSTGAGAATVSAGSTMGHKERSFSNDGSFDSGHDGTHWQQQHPFDPIVEVRLFEPIKNIVSISL